MLSVNLIERHFQGRRMDVLVEALSANGLELPLPLLIGLSQCPAAAAALALRRVLELTYGPTSLSRELTRYLLEQQQADGSFPGGPLATAAAAAALDRLLVEQPQVGQAPAGEDSSATLGPGLAYERALAALMGMQDERGLFASPNDRTEQDAALTSAFVLYLLAAQQEFRRNVRYADLMTWFEQRLHKLEPDTLRYWKMANLTVPGGKKPSRALAAIAA